MKNTKKIILPIIIATTMTLSSYALANTATADGGSANPVNPVNPGNGAIVTAINNVGKNMLAIAYAGLETAGNAMYQLDANLQNTVAVTSRKLR